MDKSLKSIVARAALLAIAAAAPAAAMAQSSVDIYGLMDLGMSSVEAVDATTGARASASSLAGAQGQYTGSRLGFRGTEDLGGGLRAGFVYEIGINADSTADGNAQTRLANLSLQSDTLGTLRIGTQYTPLHDLRDLSPVLTNLPGPREPGAWFGRHIDNAISYASPEIGDWRFEVMGMHERASNEARADARTYGGLVSAVYRRDALEFHAAFGQSDTRQEHTLKTQTLSVGARYIVSPTLELAAVAEFSDQAGQRGNGQHFARDANVWILSARTHVGNLSPFVALAGGSTQRTEGAARLDSESTAWQIGATYNLSTRTHLYAAASEQRTSGFAASRSSGVAAGLVHTF